ncbi:MAG TPA: hypothetical protein VF783_18705 [Terriglobales bacterium]
MPKDRIAEGLLVLVTNRERAASIVGDLMESSATRGRVWWWSAVLRAAASLLWGGFADSPLGMLGLAFRAWLMGLLLALTWMILASVFQGIWQVHARYVVPLILTSPVLARIIAAPCEFFVGCWIARRAPDRELSAWLALLIMDQFLSALPLIVALALGRPFWQVWRAWLTLDWMSGLLYLSCLAGTIWVRKRAVT